MKNRYIFLILLVSISFSCKVKKEVDPRILQARVLVEQVQDSSKVPGISVTVSKNKKIVWSEGFGYSDLENKTAVDPSKTLFRIGSVSKSVTSIGLGVLMQEGKINIDTSIYYYLPDFPKKRWDFTTRQVAGHLAGIRHYRGDEFLNNHHYANITEGLSIFKDDTLLFEPGTDYSYSTYGWNMVSAIMEKASGDDFLNFMQSQVFDPMKLKELQPERSDLPNLTKFYQRNEDEVELAPEVDNSYKWAGGGFVSTSENLVKFANAVFFNPKFLDDKTLNELTTSQEKSDGEKTNYGMGWVNRVDDRGHHWIGHSGGSIGGITMLIIYPEERIVVAMVSNSSNVRYNGVYHQIAWLFMDSEETNQP